MHTDSIPPTKRNFYIFSNLKKLVSGRSKRVNNAFSNFRQMYSMLSRPMRKNAFFVSFRLSIPKVWKKPYTQFAWTACEFPFLSSLLKNWKCLWIFNFICNHVHNVWYFLMVQQIFLSPKAKPCILIRNKLVYTSCLTSCWTPQDLGILGNSEISEKSQNFIEIELFP